jgi:hypothetical protein
MHGRENSAVSPKRRVESGYLGDPCLLPLRASMGLRKVIDLFLASLKQNAFKFLLRLAHVLILPCCPASLPRAAGLAGVFLFQRTLINRSETCAGISSWNLLKVRCRDHQTFLFIAFFLHQHDMNMMLCHSWLLFLTWSSDIDSPIFIFLCS